tara:strand:+ start:1060 stop:1614 length:555 start_codon:yes stop_codon:yes gene_type:complete
LIRKAAMAIALEHIEFDDRIIAANGFISRDLFSISDTKPAFYMIGSMGLASSIGLGIALKDTGRKVFVFDGDGNILMNLGSLTTIGSLKPKNLIHVIFDNSVHESTGSQPTNTNFVSVGKIAKTCNYNHTFTTKTKNDFEKILRKIKKLNGPIMIVVKIQKSNNKKSPRINYEPLEIKERFMLS